MHVMLCWIEEYKEKNSRKYFLYPRKCNYLIKKNAKWSHKHRHTHTHTQTLLLSLKINANTSGNNRRSWSNRLRVGCCPLCKSIDFIWSLPSSMQMANRVSIPISIIKITQYLPSPSLPLLGVRAFAVFSVGCCYRLASAAFCFHLFLSNLLVGRNEVSKHTNSFYKTLYMRHKYLLLKCEHATKKRKEREAVVSTRVQ